MERLAAAASTGEGTPTTPFTNKGIFPLTFVLNKIISYFAIQFETGNKREMDR
jgi:hypothetical protein